MLDSADVVTSRAPTRSRLLAALRRHRIAFSVLGVLLVVMAAVDVRLFMFPAADRAQPTDAIVVLGGSTYLDRLHAARRLQRQDPESVLVVSTPGNNPCPRYPSSASRVICFRPDPSTTQGEARATAALAREHGWTSVTVVTTADQVWRARLRFARCWSGDLRVVEAPTGLFTRVFSVPYEMGATVKAEVFQRSC